MPNIWLFSDLHLDVATWSPREIPTADVAVIPGDLGEGLVDSVEWVAAHVRPNMPVVLVAGNHEFYGRSHDEELTLGRRVAAARDVSLLENDTVEVAGILFSGCTLWTDYGIDGAHRRLANREAARVGMRDHSRIAWRTHPRWVRFGPEEAEVLHAESLTFLEGALSARPATTARPHVVVSHHAPSGRSIARRFEGDPLNGAFVSDLDDFILRTRPTAWLHGHVHASFDYSIGSTHIACNPRGYGNENPDFDPALVLQVGR